MRYIEEESVMRNMGKRLTKNKLWKYLFMLAVGIALASLVVLLFRIITQGTEYLTWDFLTSFASRFPEQAGVKAALIGSLWLMLVVAPVSMTLGIGTAIYLEEYAKKNKILCFFVHIIN